MPELKDIIGLIASGIALATAWVAYRIKVREANTRRQRNNLVIAIEDSSTDVAPANMRRLKFILILSVVLFQVFVFVLEKFLVEEVDGEKFRTYGEIVLTIFLSVALMALNFRFMRNTHPSRLVKRARVVLNVDTSKALAHVLASVQAAGVIVARLDPENLQLVGRIPGNLWRNSYILQTQVRGKENGTSEVEIVCDAAMPSLVFDFGVNRRNMRRILDHLSSSSDVH